MNIYISLFRTMFIIAMLFLVWCAGANAKEVALKREGGIYTLPVRINRVITLDFILDSGASEVSIPADVVSTLLRSRTINETDFLPGQAYSLADGSTVRSPRFLIRELEVGSIRVTNVSATVAPLRGPLLLGQSFLQHIDSWVIDNRRNVLVIGTRHKSSVESAETSTSHYRDIGATTKRGYCSIFPAAEFGHKVVNDHCMITKFSDNSYQLVWSNKQQMQIKLNPPVIDGLNGQVIKNDINIGDS